MMAISYPSEAVIQYKKCLSSLVLRLRQNKSIMQTTKTMQETEMTEKKLKL